MKSHVWVLAISIMALGVAACSEEEAGLDETSVAQIEFPASLNPIGRGYPDDGDPCRRLGESEAVTNWLDDSAILVGCPSDADASMLDATMVGIVDGFSIVSVPAGDANPGLSLEMPIDPDALVPGTNYHATA